MIIKKAPPEYKINIKLITCRPFGTLLDSANNETEWVLGKKNARQQARLTSLCCLWCPFKPLDLKGPGVLARQIVGVDVAQIDMDCRVGGLAA